MAHGAATNKKFRPLFNLAKLSFQEKLLIDILTQSVNEIIINENAVILNGTV